MPNTPKLLILLSRRYSMLLSNGQSSILHFHTKIRVELRNAVVVVRSRLTSPRRILQQRHIHRSSRQVHVPYDAPANEDVLDCALSRPTLISISPSKSQATGYGMGEAEGLDVPDEDT
jgi:hypothetical protein